MNFAPSMHRPNGGFGAARGLGQALVACCALTVVAAAFPWSRVQFVSLWGDVTGPIALRTTAGFTCLMTSLLTALLVLSEGRSPSSKDAVRTGCLLLTGAAALALLWRLCDGAGLLHGGTAQHSKWFFVALLTVLLAVAFSRLRLQRRRATDR